MYCCMICSLFHNAWKLYRLQAPQIKMGKKETEKTVLSPKQWNIVLADDYVSLSKGEIFASVFRRYLVDTKLMYELNQSKIAEITGIESSTITKYKTGSRKPTLTAIILLSLAMRLTPERSQYLLFTAGYQLNDSQEHRIYRLFLDGCAFGEEYSIENCNLKLLKNGFYKLKS